MNHLARRLAHTTAAMAGPYVLRGLWRATRAEVRGWAAVETARRHGPLIIVFWHARFLLLPFLYPRERPLAVLISPSPDGRMIAAIIRRLGRDVIVGSARRGAVSGLLRMRRFLANGGDLGIAVDGPLGPAYRVKSGAAMLAKASGRPVITLTYATARGWAAPSWDRFWIPLPPTRGVFQWGGPLLPDPRESSQALTGRIEARLRHDLANLEAEFGRRPPWAS